MQGPGRQGMCARDGSLGVLGAECVQIMGLWANEGEADDL